MRPFCGCDGRKDSFRGSWWMFVVSDRAGVLCVPNAVRQKKRQDRSLWRLGRSRKAGPWGRLFRSQGSSTSVASFFFTGLTRSSRLRPRRITMAAATKMEEYTPKQMPMARASEK